MVSDSTTQTVLFPEIFSKAVVARLDQEDSSSDGGALLLQAADRRLGLSEALAECLRDPRQPGERTHTRLELLRQRIFGIALGDPVADEILRALRSAPDGLTRNQIRNLFSGHRSSERISKALQNLAELGLAYSRRVATEGRPAERWFATKVGCAKSAESAESPPPSDGEDHEEPSGDARQRESSSEEGRC